MGGIVVETLYHLWSRAPYWHAYIHDIHIVVLERTKATTPRVGPHTEGDGVTCHTTCTGGWGQGTMHGWAVGVATLNHNTRTSPPIEKSTGKAYR